MDYRRKLNNNRTRNRQDVLRAKARDIMSRAGAFSFFFFFFFFGGGGEMIMTHLPPKTKRIVNVSIQTFRKIDFLPRENYRCCRRSRRDENLNLGPLSVVKP